jgi:hypothetical protein
MAYGCPSRVLQGLAALAAVIASLACRAAADEPDPSPSPSLETWSGAQVFGAEWSLYGGASWAPFGSVRENGFRLRAVLGSGAYPGASVAFGDVLIGYHMQLGPLTLKLLGGLTVAAHSPTEPTSLLAGTALGPKALVETWWTITDKAWTSLDLAVAIPYMQTADGMADAVDPNRIDYTGRLRVGWKLWPELSVGFEGGAGGPLAPTLHTIWQNGWQNGQTFAGGFLRYEWASGEVSVSGGALLGGDEREGHTRPFGTVSVLTRF